MIAIERTAYPTLNANRTISQKTLYSSYMLSPHEIEHIKYTVRTNKLRLQYPLQLKTFQNLGYFIETNQIPQTIVDHLRNQLSLIHNVQVPTTMHSTTLYRYNQSIRNYLGTTPWGLRGSESARRVAIKAAYQNSQVLNTPADIINIVIEELRTQRFELPAFSTLCRLVRHVRARVNNTIFQQVFDQLTQANKIPILKELLKIPDGKTYSLYQKLKDHPKRPRINNFKDLTRHHAWLLTLGNMKSFLKNISQPKRLQFAQEAKSLDFSTLSDLLEPRRYTLIACLIDYTQKQTKDNLGEAFCKTMANVHKRARSELSTLREENTEKTQDLAYLMRDILGIFKDAKNAKTFFTNVSDTIESKGGVEELTQACEEVIACNSSHHHSLLWGYFKLKRSAIFNVLETIQLGSSTQNDHLMRALSFLIENRYKRTETLKALPGLSNVKHDFRLSDN